ncbi:MAG: radical SAM protein [Deltaproteobacteria bacterium]|nr:radical SAM protein [Deltaproteobacteria bacterium]
MKVLFVMPPLGAWSTWGSTRAPNQFYAQLAAYLREKGTAEVDVLEARILEMTVEEMIEEVKSREPDVVVMGDVLHTTGGAAIIWHFNMTAQKIKETLPGCRIAVGGLWYSALYRETLETNPAIDFILVGEAEETLRELVEGLASDGKKLAETAGLASRKNGTVVMGPHRELISNLDLLPLPAYDLFPMDKYVGHTYWENYCEIFTSRGCPGGCSFCYEWSMYDPRFPKDFTSWRCRSAKQVVDELELLTKRFGVKTVVFLDDAFNVSTQLVEETCNEIIRRDIKINWVILGRAPDWIRQADLFPLMKKAGLFMGLVGIEVATDQELRSIGKGITTSQAKETIKKLREHDIATIGTFLIGFENDDEKKIKERFDFADQVDPDIFALHFVTPMPGSPVWKKKVRQRQIEPKDLDLRRWDLQHPVVPTKHLSVEELGRLGAWCSREFYSRPERIHRIMEGNYSPLVKLCVKDFMSNVSNFERAAAAGEVYI